MLPKLPDAWRPQLVQEFDKPYFEKLQTFLDEEQKSHTVYPAASDIFNALELTPYKNVKVLLLGQDPYPGEGQAHGLAFSVKPGVRPPASLVNIYKELRDDVGFRIPAHGSLTAWAKQGILLLNAVLTVRAGETNSHRNKGWEIFTDTIIQKVNDKKSHVVFVLWGRYAQKKAALIDARRHTVIECAHPSPLAARSGFFGCRPFSAVNDALRAAGQKEIDWQLPDI